MEEKNYEAIVEAILFTMGESVELEKIAAALELDKKETKKIIENLMKEYEKPSIGMKIIELDEQKKRIVCSRKAVIAEEAAAKKKEVWDKLQEGDKFYLHIMDEVLAYQVDQVKVVLPEETDDLTIVQGQDYCTLVTCTPYAINTHRMLVRGTRVPYNGEEETGDTPQAVQYQALHTGTVVKRIVDAWPWISVTGSVIIGGEALLLLLLLHRCKKREEDD